MVTHPAQAKLQITDLCNESRDFLRFAHAGTPPKINISCVFCKFASLLTKYDTIFILKALK
jgi:hypothetical protein